MTPAARRRVEPGETGVKKTQLGQGAKRPWGKLRDVKRPACLQWQTGACRSYGPSCMSAVPQTCGIDRSARRTPTGMPRTGRGTHLDQGIGDEAQDALRSRCPADEAINPNRRTVPSGRRTNVKLQPPDCAEDEGPVSTPSFRPVLLAKDQRQTPQWQHSLVGDPMVRPVQQGSRTQVSMVGNLGESQTVHSLLLHPEPDVKTFGVQPPKSFSLVPKNIR